MQYDSHQAMVDPFGAKRAAMREEFFAKLFLLGGWLGGTDTYKRTMWTAVPDIARSRTDRTSDLASVGHSRSVSQEGEQGFNEALDRGRAASGQHGGTEVGESQDADWDVI